MSHDPSGDYDWSLLQPCRTGSWRTMSTTGITFPQAQPLYQTRGEFLESILVRVS